MPNLIDPSVWLLDPIKKLGIMRSTCLPIGHATWNWAIMDPPRLDPAASPDDTVPITRVQLRVETIRYPDTMAVQTVLAAEPDDLENLLRLPEFCPTDPHLIKAKEYLERAWFYRGGGTCTVSTNTSSALTIESIEECLRLLQATPALHPNDDMDQLRSGACERYPDEFRRHYYHDWNGWRLTEREMRDLHPSLAVDFNRPSEHQRTSNMLRPLDEWADEAEQLILESRQTAEQMAVDTGDRSQVPQRSHDHAHDQEDNPGMRGERVTPKAGPVSFLPALE